MGVVGWGCLISITVVCISTDFWPLVNKAPSLASMAKAITLCMIENPTQSGPLGSGSTVGGLVGYFDLCPTKPPTVLSDPDGPLCIGFSIMHSVMALAMEAKLGALFTNDQKSVLIQQQ